MLLTRAYHEDRGEHRTKVLTPDTAHGTNPATVTMAGYEVVKVGTDADGNVDLEDLRAKATEDVACLMLTNPSTLGLFEPQIAEIAEIVHGVGATLYYDGANLNAIMGICRPGDMGFDIVHFNLHKSFTQPHGGGGPGAGPIAVVGPDRAVPAAPAGRPPRRAAAQRRRADATIDLDYDRPKSIGRLRGFQGNYGVFVRSYAYIRSLGAAACARPQRSPCSTPTTCSHGCARRACSSYLPAAYERLCMHEFVLSGAPMKRELEIKTLDLAKRLLDHGVHPPTVYFPLIVEEALLIEPTETETRETLDRFAEIVAEILREAAEDPEIARGAPYRPRCAASTRPARPATRCCAKHSDGRPDRARHERSQPRILDEIDAVGRGLVSSGEIPGAEQAVALCQSFLPDWRIERVPCSTQRTVPRTCCATLSGTGAAVLLLGHLDTVVGHAEHQPPRARRRAALRVRDRRHEGRRRAGARRSPGRSRRPSAVRRAGGAARLRRGVADRAVRARRALRRVRRLPLLRGRRA